jgi:hypothetical protein
MGCGGKVDGYATHLDLARCFHLCIPTATPIDAHRNQRLLYTCHIYSYGPCQIHHLEARAPLLWGWKRAPLVVRCALDPIT